VKDIVISYAHEDRDTAREIAGLLEASDLSVWRGPQLRTGELLKRYAIAPDSPPR